MNTKFPPSDLIITPKGSIYHLDLTPDQIGDLIFTVGDPERVGQVSRYFDTIEHKVTHREFATHTGTCANQRVSVMSTGMGTDNIDIFLHELDALANIDFNTRQVKSNLKSLTIVRIGTTGGFQADIDLGDFIVSDHAIGLDGLMHYYQFPQDDSLIQQFNTHMGESAKAILPYIARGDQDLVEQFSNAGFIRGNTVTCGGFYGPQARPLRAKLNYPDFLDKLQTFKINNTRLTNFEMESAAMYGLSQLFNHRCCSLNVVVANRVANTFSDNTKELADRLIKKAFEVMF